MKTQAINITALRRAYIQYGFYVVPTVVMTVVVFLTMLVLIPGVKQGLDSRQQLITERGRLTKLTDKLVALERLDRADLDRRVGVMEAALPSTKDVGSFLMGIRQVAQRSGVGLTSVDLSPGELKGKPAEAKGSVAKVAGQIETGVVPIEVKLIGDLPAILTFLDGVNQAVPTMTARSLTIGQEGANFQIKVKLEASFWPQPESLGAAEKPLGNLTAEEEQLYQQVLGRVGVALAGQEASQAAVPVGNPNLMGVFEAPEQVPED